MKTKEIYECVVFNAYMEGKISYEKYEKLNEFVKNKKLTDKEKLIMEQYVRKTVHSLAGLAVGGPVAWVAYRAIRGMFDKCAKACGTISINTFKRQLCMANCKAMSAKKELIELNKIANQCNGTPNPNKCKQKIAGTIKKAQQKLMAAQMELQKVKVAAVQKGKSPIPS